MFNLILLDPCRGMGENVEKIFTNLQIFLSHRILKIVLIYIRSARILGQIVGILLVSVDTL